MNDAFFTQLSLIAAIVAVVSLLMRVLRQPLITGYIISGVIVGPVALNIIKSHDALTSFSTIGITLLLFIIGLGLNANVIRSLGRVALTTSISVMIPLGLIGFFVSRLLGFPMATSLVLAVTLLFSSTIIILKMLSDNKETSRLFGQIATGVLLIEDVVASIALVILASMSKTDGSALSSFDIALIVLKALAVGAGLAIAAKWILPYVTKWFAGSQESLFLFTVGWGLVIATLFNSVGLSYEVGALFAGVSVASLPYATEMAARLKPLRDFFIVMFFVNLGTTFTTDSIRSGFVTAIALAAVIVIGKPLLVLVSLGLQGYTKLTSFKTAIHLSQMSEFSIIFISLAAALGQVDSGITSLVVLTAFISIGISSYLMKYSHGLYTIFEHQLRHFERSVVREKKVTLPLYPVILFGYHKGGHEFLEAFREMELHYLVVDYNPEIIEHLEQQGIRHAYGDMTDEEFLEEINAAKAQLVVSTVDSLTINLITLKYLRRHNADVSFVCHALSYEDAATLYEHGASYVSLPHYIGSERVSNFIKRHGMSHEALSSYRDRHLVTIGRSAVQATEPVTLP